MRILDIINEDVNEGPIDWALAKMGNQKAKVKQSDSGEVKRIVSDFMAKARDRATPALLARYLSAAGFPVTQRKITRVLQIGDNEFMQNPAPVAQQSRQQSTQQSTQQSRKPQKGDKKKGYTFQGAQWTKDSTNGIASKADRARLGLDTGKPAEKPAEKPAGKPQKGDRKKGYTFQGAQWTKDSTKSIASKADRARLGLDESTLVEANTLSKAQVKKVVDYFVKKGGRENISPTRRSRNAYSSRPRAAQSDTDNTAPRVAQSDTDNTDSRNAQPSDREMLATLNKAASILSRAGISGVRVIPDYD
jgi:hypothetical protein